MSFLKKIKKASASLIPSPIKIDFQKGGGRIVQEVAPYPKEDIGEIMADRTHQFILKNPL